MIKLLIAVTASVGACQAPPDTAPTTCPPGEITVVGDEATGCDLTAANTLTVLAITEADCAQRGGDWWYEACLDTDF